MKIHNCDTMDDPIPHFRDETERVHCRKCGHYFRLTAGFSADFLAYQLSTKHLELCQGDAAETLKKVQAWWSEQHPTPSCRPKPLTHRQRIERARDKVQREIAALRMVDIFSEGLASEGYAGGYRDALEDVLLLLNNVTPRRRDYWDTE